MIASVHELRRNDMPAAVALLKAEAARGPVGTDLLQTLAMLQDSPRDFYAAIESIDYSVRES